MRREQWRKAMEIRDAVWADIMARTGGVGIPTEVIEEVLRESKAD